MGWHTTGDERGKGYRVYKQLEVQYERLQEAYDALEVELERKNSTIRALSKELANYATTLVPGSETVASIAQSLVEAAQREAPDFPTPPMHGPRPLRKAHTPPVVSTPPDTRTLAERMQAVQTEQIERQKKASGSR